MEHGAILWAHELGVDVDHGVVIGLEYSSSHRFLLLVVHSQLEELIQKLVIVIIQFFERIAFLLQSRLELVLIVSNHNLIFAHSRLHHLCYLSVLDFLLRGACLI